MAQPVMRYQIADYINTAAAGAAEAYALMGVGYNTLDESPSAQTDEKTYIHERTQTSTIKGYQTSFSFDTDLIADEGAVMTLYDVGRNQLTGADAQRDYVRVELFKPISGSTTEFEARKFVVAVQVDSVSGSGGEVVQVSGTLGAVGDFIDGKFDTQTKTFTANT